MAKNQFYKKCPKFFFRIRNNKGKKKPSMFNIFQKKCLKKKGNEITIPTL